MRQAVGSDRLEQINVIVRSAGNDRSTTIERHWSTHAHSKTCWCATRPRSVAR
jgi:hypothetical protein